MTSFPSMALGVKVFSRVEKLEGLLNSVPSNVISNVYIADDGKPSEAKRSLYQGDYPFELEVFDLEFDAGLGAGRYKIATEFDEKYLLITDTDHKIPPNVEVLQRQLQADHALGGVSGLLLENGRIQGTCHDLIEEGGNLIRDVRETKSVRRVGKYPLIPFDFLPNVALFRRACIKEQAWDPEYVIGKEHLDFYVAHKRRTDWKFGVSPTVVFDHDPSSDAEYKANRTSYPKLTRSDEYFKKKWGYRQIVHGQTDWIDPSTGFRDPKFISELLFKTVFLKTPSWIQTLGMDIREMIRRVRGRPPL